MLRNAYENSTTAAARVLAERLVPTGSPLHKATVDRVLGPSRAYGRPASIVAPQTVRAMGRGLMMGRIPLPVTSSIRRQSSSSASGPAGNISKTVQLAPVVGCGKRVPGVVIDSSVTARQEDAAVKGILVKKGKKALRGLKKVVTISDEDRVKWFTRCELELCDVAVTSSLVERLDISEEEEDHSCLVDEVCPFSMDEVCDWPEVPEGSKPVEVAEESKPVEEAQGSKPVEEAQGSKPVEEQEEVVLEEGWIMDEVCPFSMDEECGWPEVAEGSKPVEVAEGSKPAEVAEESKPAEVAEESKPAEVAEESKPVGEAQGSKPVEEAQGSKPVEEQEEVVLEEDWIMDEVCPFRMDEECDWPEEAQGSKPSEEPEGSTPDGVQEGSKPAEEHEEIMLEEDWIWDEACPFDMDGECGWPEEAQGSEADG